MFSTSTSDRKTRYTVYLGYVRGDPYISVYNVLVVARSVYGISLGKMLVANFCAIRHFPRDSTDVGE
eukprot:628280-Pleurochrysis_carterae.AAC.1